MRNTLNRFAIAALLCIWCAVGAYGGDIVSLNSDAGTQWQLFPVGNTLHVRVAKVGYEPKEYVDGIVPGTVLAAYVAAGEEEEPSYGDNVYNIDETKYNQSYWYRTTFHRPAADGKRVVLVLEGINRYATVYLNGKKLQQVRGHVMMMRHDITDLLADENCLAVKVEMPASEFLPRTSNFANYVMPTYVASHSWDWMPYVPGLNCGITNDIYLELTGDVTLRDPWVRSTLSNDNAEATLQMQTSVVNLSGEAKTATVTATLMPGGMKTSKTIALAAGDSIDVALNDMTLNNPLLWWPNGSGPQNLYTCRFDVEIDGATVDTKTATFGVRRYEYRKENTTMVVYVNGKKVYCKGGNWGMSEFMLRCRGDEYDMRMRLHKDMNFNMIRLWTGCVTDEELYDACDKYGIMIWDDFWLTGPYTGLTGPNDRKEFVANVRDKVIRLRNHPSVAVWCGCNEGWPYDELNQDIISIIHTYDADERVYIPNSHNGYPTRAQYDAQDGSGLGLSGSGWWTNYPPEEYFEKGLWGGGGDQGDKVDWGFRSELGMAAFTTFESFKEFMPEDCWWPRNEMWEKHFFSDQAAYGGAASATKYFNDVSTGYGESASAEQFCERAQLLNIEVMKAIYEGWQDNLWNTASGLLFWMSQSAYPCFIWQTYDYYYDTTGTYWGAKKACEPVHIQWNCSNNTVNVVNTSGSDVSNLSATIEMYRLDGTPYARNCTTINDIAVPTNEVKNIYNIRLITYKGVYFLRLRLFDEDKRLVSENFYWDSTVGSKNDYSDLNTLKEAKLSFTPLSTETTDGIVRKRIRIENVETDQSMIAFAIRVRLVDPATERRILPVIMEDNYFTLFAGESKELTLEYYSNQCSDEPQVLVKQYGYPECDCADITGISAIEGDSAQQPAAIYTLSGQRLPSLPTQPGIYVRDGKKIVVR